MAYLYFLLGSSLSEALKISAKNANDWLEKETGSIFIPVHEKARKLLGRMEKTLDSVTDVCKMLLENSKKEIEKRNMKTYRRARALNKLARLFLERIQQIEVPDKVTYDSFYDFVQETRKAFIVTEVDVRNWFPRISPFFIMDRRKFLGAFEKAKESLKELHNFLTKEYVKTKTLEETFQLINNLLAFEGKLADLEAQKKKVETEKASIEKKIDGNQREMADLRNRENLTQLDQISIEIEKLSLDVKYSLRHLRKPFVKLQSQVFREGGLTPEELEKLNHYIENPFKAFSSEEAQYPMLKRILKKLSSSVSKGKLKLKHDRKRKAEQAIDKTLNKNALDDLHRKCKELTIRKMRLSASAETTKIKGDLSKLQEKLKKLERIKERVDLEDNATERRLKETLERVHKQKKEIERNVFDFLGKQILIEV